MRHLLVPLPRRPSSRGAALIVVLGAVLLLTVIVMAFFSSVRTDYVASRYSADGSSVRSLADSVVQIVQSQIYRATTTNASAPFAWASQPGMIRTYDSKGQRLGIYRLYSWDPLDQSVGPTSDVVADDFAKLSAWSNSPAIFCDLNAPETSTKDGLTVTNFPILDPNLAAGNRVEGFSIGASLGASASRAPMPVRWLYVLLDGQVVAPAESGGNTANFAASPVKPTAANPIVGRFAFWTDDETCKLNVNTASEGTPWDSPRSNTRTDRGQLIQGPTSGRIATPGYASAMPAAHEFNRTPGHPAMTCLSPLFTNLVELLKIPEAPHGWSSQSDFDNYAKVLQRYLDLAPRVDWRRSPGTSTPAGSYGGSRTNDNSDVISDRNPLYASVDEFFFATNRNQSFSDLTPAALSGLRFFLTTSSRAPDLTPFNTPRILLWPLTEPASDGQRGVKDALIAKCGTVGSNFAYYLQRGAPAQVWNSGSPRITPAGRNSSAFRPDSFFDASTAWGKRNDDLRKYLDKMMQLEVPGIGGSFLQKYGADNTEQLQVQMLDYIRSLVNLRQVDSVPSRSYNYSFESRYVGGTGSFEPIEGSSVAGGVSFVAPLRSPGGKIGFGRSQIITEVGLLFYATSPTTMRAMVLMQPTLLSPADRAMSPWLTYRFKGLSGLAGLNMPAGDVELETGIGSAWTSRDGRWPYSNFYSPFVNYKPGEYGLNAIRAMGTEYTPVSTADIPISTNSYNFAGGRFQIELFSGGDASKPLQTYSFYFPPMPNLPVPKFDPANPENPIQRMTKQAKAKFGSANDLREGISVLIGSNDVTRSLTVSVANGPRGDFRLVAAHPRPPESWFVQDPQYLIPAIPQLHSFRSSSIELYRPWEPRIGAAGVASRMGLNANSIPRPRAELGPDPRLVAGKLFSFSGDQTRLYDTFCAPTVPRRLAGARMATGREGDYDNGYGAIPDGPYIGPPDLYWGEAYHSVSGADQSLSDMYYPTGPGDAYYLPDKNTAERAVAVMAARQAPSAVRFGSLPTGVWPDTSPSPWQTLLFCPNPASRRTAPRTAPSSPFPSAGADHKGFGTARAPGAGGGYTEVPDFALLDFFHMPVVEPYPISEPASTAGKVNLNWQIAPFTNVVRTTALRGILKSVRPAAFVNIGAYKESDPDIIYKSDAQLPNFDYRYDINRDRTLEGWGVRFREGDIYRQPSEVCSLFLVPARVPGLSSVYGAGPSTANLTYGNLITDFWNRENGITTRGMTLTGDNTREAPYGEIYPRLTTRSNSYTVHVRVQSLRQIPAGRATAAAWAVWNEESDAIAADYRGSTTIERYLDPNDPRLPDCATAFQSDPTDPRNNLNRFYRFRTVSQKQFSP